MIERLNHIIVLFYNRSPIYMTKLTILKIEWAVEGEEGDEQSRFSKARPDELLL